MTQERDAIGKFEKFGIALSYILFVISITTLAVQVKNLYFNIFVIMIILSISVYAYGVYMERIRIKETSTQTQSTFDFILV